MNVQIPAGRGRVCGRAIGRMQVSRKQEAGDPTMAKARSADPEESWS
jgi:hypothetical protein